MTDWGLVLLFVNTIVTWVPIIFKIYWSWKYDSYTPSGSSPEISSSVGRSLKRFNIGNAIAKAREDSKRAGEL